MRFAFTEEQDQIAEAVGQALAAECPPSVVRGAAVERPLHLWDVLDALGVTALNLPEAAGGLGMGPCDWVKVAEAAGYHALPLPLSEQLALNPILDAPLRVTLAAPGALVPDADVSDAVYLLLDDTLHRVEDAQCWWIPSVDDARWAFRVSGVASPLTIDPVPVVDRATLATAAQLLGGARRMLDLAVDYAKARRQFGRAIGSFQAVQHHLADALLAITFATASLHRAAWSLQVGAEAASRDVAAAKAQATAAARTARKKALQVHGAIGYTLECDLQLWLKRSLALEAAWGDDTFHRASLAAALGI